MPHTAALLAKALELVLDARQDLAALRGNFRVAVAGVACELPMAHSWQAIPGVEGVEMATLDPSQWPANPLPNSDYHLLRGPGGSHSPGLLLVPQAIELKLLTGHQRYWKESAPTYIDYWPGDVFTCGAGEGHQWETLQPFCNLVAFTPALIPRPSLS